VAARKKQRPMAERVVELLGVVGRLTEQHGYPPTLGEIGRVMKITPARVMRIADVAQEAGQIDRKPNSARTIRVVVARGTGVTAKGHRAVKWGRV